MQDYYDVQPDEVYILGKHYTRGRGGAQIQFITRHHLMYIGDGKAVVDRIWNTRAASAHYVIDPNGKTTQTVWDGNTAWANASQWANQRTIAIEHSNNTGRHPGGTDYHDKSWNISDKTLIAGARLAAALCLYYKLGRPTYGTNIRDHNEFTSTGCPVHLQGPRAGNAWGGRAGKYHNMWMAEAQRFYDLLVAKKVRPDGTPITPPPTSSAPQIGDPMHLIRSLVNTAKSFTQDTMLALIDRATWEIRVIVNELARRQGIDPDAVVADAIRKDNQNG